MKLNKIQLDRFIEQLEQKRNAYIMRHRGNAPATYEMSEEVMLKQIADGVAKLKPDAGEYDTLKEAFEFVLTPEALAMEAAYDAWDQHDDEVRGRAQAMFDATLNKLIFAGTGGDVIKLLEDTFKD